MAESNRTVDMKCEQALARYMDRCFYEKLCRRSSSASFARKTDAATQLKGIDVELVIDGTKYLIDEKASIYYSNTMLSTFAFEIDSLQKNHVRPIPGWFVNNELETDYYMLIWPNVKCDQKDGVWQRLELKELTDSSFTIVEAMLIKKTKLLSALEDQGLSVDKMRADADELRRSTGGKKIRHVVQYQWDRPCKLMYSGTIKEQPINLVIRRDFLKPLAEGIWLIAEDGYAPIKDLRAQANSDTPDASSELLTTMELQDSCTITDIARALNKLRANGKTRKLTAVQLNNILEDNGYLESIESPWDPSRTMRVPTKKGTAAGIELQPQQGRDGEQIMVPRYNRKGQKMVLDLLLQNQESE